MKVAINLFPYCDISEWNGFLNENIGLDFILSIRNWVDNSLLLISAIMSDGLLEGMDYGLMGTPAYHAEDHHPKRTICWKPAARLSSVFFVCFIFQFLSILDVAPQFVFFRQTFLENKSVPNDVVVVSTGYLVLYWLWLQMVSKLCLLISQLALNNA